MLHSLHWKSRRPGHIPDLDLIWDDVKQELTGGGAEFARQRIAAAQAEGRAWINVRNARRIGDKISRRDLGSILAENYKVPNSWLPHPPNILSDPPGLLVLD